MVILSMNCSAKLLSSMQESVIFLALFFTPTHQLKFSLGTRPNGDTPAGADGRGRRPIRG